MTDKAKMYFDSLFTYSNGQLIWKERPESHFKSISSFKRHNVLIKGKVAGNINKGYREVFLNKKRIGVHRIVFAMHHGYMPSMVDHIDGNPLNNKIENLRECTPSQNQYNRRIDAKSKSGVKGVHWNKKANKWQANIRVGDKLKHLGVFDNIEDASLARMKAAEFFHGEFVNHG